MQTARTLFYSTHTSVVKIDISTYWKIVRLTIPAYYRQLLSFTANAISIRYIVVCSTFMKNEAITSKCIWVFVTRLRQHIYSFPIGKLLILVWNSTINYTKHTKYIKWMFRFRCWKWASGLKCSGGNHWSGQFSAKHLLHQKPQQHKHQTHNEEEKQLRLNRHTTSIKWLMISETDSDGKRVAIQMFQLWLIQ